MGPPQAETFWSPGGAVEPRTSVLGPHRAITFLSPGGTAEPTDHCPNQVKLCGRVARVARVPPNWWV